MPENYTQPTPIPETYAAPQGVDKSGVKGMEAEVQGGDVSEESKEKFREHLRKTQAAQKKAYATEGKAKVYDNTLAHIITSLLIGRQSNHLVVLLTRLIELNIPADFIVAILSLINKEATDVVSQREKEIHVGDQELDIKIFSCFSSSSQKEIHKWGRNVLGFAKIDAQKVFETVIQSHSWTIQPELIELTNYVLEKCLKKHHQSVKEKDPQAFSKSFFENILKILENQLK